MFVIVHKIRKQILYKMCQNILEIYSVLPWHPTGLDLHSGDPDVTLWADGTGTGG